MLWFFQNLKRGPWSVRDEESWQDSPCGDPATHQQHTTTVCGESGWIWWISGWVWIEFMNCYIYEFMNCYIYEFRITYGWRWYGENPTSGDANFERYSATTWVELEAAFLDWFERITLWFDYDSRDFLAHHWSNLMSPHFHAAPDITFLFSKIKRKSWTLCHPVVCMAKTVLNSTEF